VIAAYCSNFGHFAIFEPPCGGLTGAHAPLSDVMGNTTPITNDMWKKHCRDRLQEELGQK